MTVNKMYSECKDKKLTFCKPSTLSWSSVTCLKIHFFFNYKLQICVIQIWLWQNLRLYSAYTVNPPLILTCHYYALWVRTYIIMHALIYIYTTKKQLLTLLSAWVRAVLRLLTSWFWFCWVCWSSFWLVRFCWRESLACWSSLWSCWIWFWRAWAWDWTDFNWFCAFKEGRGGLVWFGLEH